MDKRPKFVQATLHALAQTDDVSEIVEYSSRSREPVDLLMLACRWGGFNLFDRAVSDEPGTYIRLRDCVALLKERADITYEAQKRFVTRIIDAWSLSLDGDTSAIWWLLCLNDSSDAYPLLGLFMRHLPFRDERTGAHRLMTTLAKYPHVRDAVLERLADLPPMAPARFLNFWTIVFGDLSFDPKHDALLPTIVSHCVKHGNTKRKEVATVMSRALVHYTRHVCDPSSALRVFVENGADVRYKHNQSLVNAIVAENKDVVGFLLRNGAYPFARQLGKEAIIEGQIRSARSKREKYDLLYFFGDQRSDMSWQTYVEPDMADFIQRTVRWLERKTLVLWALAKISVRRKRARDEE